MRYKRIFSLALAVGLIAGAILIGHNQNVRSEAPPSKAAALVAGGVARFQQRAAPLHPRGADPHPGGAASGHTPGPVPERPSQEEQHWLRALRLLEPQSAGALRPVGTEPGTVLPQEQVLGVGGQEA